MGGCMIKNSLVAKLKEYANRLKQELILLHLSYKDERTPWLPKVIALCVVAYAFSPIDLIPDFIPVLGFLDDLIIVPLGISLALKLIPQQILDDNRIRAQELSGKSKPKNWFVGMLFIFIWILLAVWLGKLIFHLFY
jgi:uncharacterized membrane protein YkvA (DUF1232 family)